MNKLVFATHNLNKLREVQQMLGNTFSILSLSDINCQEDIPETQPTIEGNALQKARYVFENYGVDCFADDTGLEIEALDGRPGVFSARYAGEPKDDEANIQKVLSELNGNENRNARFKTVFALIINSKEYLFEGTVEGFIASEKHGHSGFGYDPVFFPKGYTESFAQMTAAEKNRISHRGLATQKLVSFLSEQ